MSSAKLQTNNDWLIWARKTAYYDIDKIAKEMKVDSNQIEEWENTGKIEYDDLVKLAEYYQRHPMIFFNVNEPKYDEPIPDFRTFGSKETKITPDIIFEIRNASIKREILLEIEDESPDYNIPKFKLANINFNSINEVISFISDEMEITPAKIHRKTIDDWIKEVEKLGVLIFQFYDVEPTDLRGYALYHDKLPIIGINNKEYKNGKKFTLFHELAHLILRKDGLSNFNEYFLHNQIEFKCNKIAAETLVPSDLLKSKIELMESPKKWTESKIKHLSTFFKVSDEVIVRRLLTLKYVTPSFYKSKKEEFDSYICEKERKSNSRSSRRKKTANKNIKSSEDMDPRKLFQRNATTSLKKNGVLFTYYILKAYDENLISIDEVADDLGVSIEVIREIQERFSLEES